MNWLSKILKKDKKIKADKQTEEKIISVKPNLAPVAGNPKRIGAGTESVRPALKKIDKNVLLAHHLTEKTSLRKEESKYVFKVSSGANKAKVRNAVEGRYGVRVRSVSILNTFGKERKRGRQIGFKPGFKKAIVALESGQSIEIT